MRDTDRGVEGGTDGRAESDTDGEADTERADETGGRPCPVCERAMVHRHCKYVCPEHGVVYDCSDTFY